MRTFLVRGASGVLLVALSGCAASARTRPQRDPAHIQHVPAATDALVETRSAHAADPPSSVQHRIRKGENLFRISKQYAVSVEALKHANGIRDVHQVRAGQVLVIPGVSGETSSLHAAVAANKRPAGKLRRGIAGGIISAGMPAGPGLPGPDAAPLGVSFTLLPTQVVFSWPVVGGITRSAFGKRRGRLHAGVDISAPVGSDVLAAADGRVVYSGHKFQGYGNVIMLDHGDGFVTVYAHNSKNLVIEGDEVARGQAIGKVGATGNATGSHCHFEIRKHDGAVDPARYCGSGASDGAFASLGSGSGAALARASRAGISPTPDPIP